MGISGLLPQLKAIQNPVSLHRYEGQTLGIDGYAWLHRAACSCAMELALDKPTTKYLEFFVKKIAMLKAFKIEPYFIFDGDSIGVKKETEVKRRTKRIESRNIAQQLWESGEKRNAMDYFLKSVDITPEMAKCIIDYCKTNCIQYIVAPFEADAQMVYLERKGLIQGIISEDSDLLIFGCQRLLTKLNDFGECIEICKDDFDKLPSKFPLNQLNEDEVRTMVCLSGCDYTDGVPKVGLITAMKLVIRFRTLDRILLHIQREGKLRIPSDFVKQYELANFAFQYQRVFCPISCKMATLNQIPENLLHCDELYKCIGDVIDKKDGRKKIIDNDEDIDHDLHYKISRGNISPYNSQKLLVNREHKLQINSRSDLQTIDSFFKMGPKQQRYSQTKPILTSTTANLDKIDATIKRRKLNQDANAQLGTSKFFTSFGAPATNPTITPATTPSITPTTTPVSTQEDVQTEIPESQLPTQIPSSFDVEHADDEDLSEILSEVDDETNCEILDPLIKTPAAQAPPSHSRNITGTTVALQQFRYSNNRVPLQVKNINTKSDLNLQVRSGKKLSHEQPHSTTTLRSKVPTPMKYAPNIVVRARTASQQDNNDVRAQRPAIRATLSARFVYKPT